MNLRILPRKFLFVNNDFAIEVSLFLSAFENFVGEKDYFIKVILRARIVNPRYRLLRTIYKPWNLYHCLAKQVNRSCRGEAVNCLL